MATQSYTITDRAQLAADALVARLEAAERRLIALGHVNLAAQARTYAGYVRSDAEARFRWDHWCGQLENAALCGEQSLARAADRGCAPVRELAA